MVIHQPDTNQETQITAADLTDLMQSSAVVELLDAYAQSEMGGGTPLKPSVREHLISRLKKRADTVVLLAYKQQKAIGLLIGFEGFSTFACQPLLNIHDIFVAEAYRGQGIVGQLLHQAEQIARQRDYCKMTLEVLANNLAAQNSYKKSGFAGYALGDTTGLALFWQKWLN